MPDDTTRVVSMVPSWTETLIKAGVQVVGRTRFCLHPADVVRSIPIVGGTKDWNEEKVRAARPDLLVLDREENPKWMAEQPDLPYWASHISSVSSLPAALEDLAQTLAVPYLGDLARRWQAVCQQPVRRYPKPDGDWPGVIEWGRRPTAEVSTVLYVIWRDPWMAVGPETFIGSVLQKLGMTVHPNPERYPVVDLQALPADTLLLFSSEPFPFLRRREGLKDLANPYALVDGESFSWFGVRSLEFLEQTLLPPDSP